MAEQQTNERFASNLPSRFLEDSEGVRHTEITIDSAPASVLHKGHNLKAYEVALNKFRQQINDLSRKYTGYTIISLKCYSCDNVLKTPINNLKKIKNEHYYCKGCKSRLLWHNKQYRNAVTKPRNISQKRRKQLSERMKRLWEDGHYKELKSPDFSKKMSCVIKKRWEKREYKNKMHHHLTNIRPIIDKNKQSIITKGLWDNPEYRSKMLEIFKSDEYKRKIAIAFNRPWPKISKIKLTKEELLKLRSTNSIKRWQTQEYRDKINKTRNTPEFRKLLSNNTKKAWTNEEYRNKIYEHWRNLPKVSACAKTFYSILDDINIKYYREYNDKPDDKECQIGPYSWDCVIPRTKQKTLLIDINGDWTHSSKLAQEKDARKFSYINNNLSDYYEVKYIWQHELYNKDKIVSLIEYWTKAKIKTIDYDFNELEIKQAPAKDYKILLSKYHYLSNAGRGGIAYGAYHNNILIAICVFSPVVRQNIHKSLSYERNMIREISRFCIHPAYRKENLGSWFISRCIKLLDNNFKCIIAYADSTFNHTGAVYKSLNFRQDKIVRPDYWYISNDGWVMHKKTLYDRAVNSHMTEAEFAAAKGYTKVFGKEKFRFVLIRG